MRLDPEVHHGDPREEISTVAKDEIERGGAHGHDDGGSPVGVLLAEKVGKRPISVFAGETSAIDVLDAILRAIRLPDAESRANALVRDYRPGSEPLVTVESHYSARIAGRKSKSWRQVEEKEHPEKKGGAGRCKWPPCL